MKFTLIIPVYNRLNEVKELLDSAELLVFDRKLFEILFVDDGSKDGFKDFINTYNSLTGLSIRAIFQSNNGPGAARNYGMKEARGEYFLFIDSDVIFPTDYLNNVNKGLESKTLDAFGGPDGAHKDFAPLVKAINYSMTSFLGTGGTRGGKKSVGKFYPRSFNMGIHRKVFEKIGGMGGLRHGQDMDFSARIYKAGFSVGLIPDALVYHKRRTSIPKFFRQIFNWGVARINLGTLHSNMLKPVHFLPAIMVVVFALGIIGLWIPNPTIQTLAILILLGQSFISLLAFVDSLILKKNTLHVALLSIMTLNIQVFGYGMGLLSALYQKYILGKKEVTGFVKNYYGKK